MNGTTYDVIYTIADDGIHLVHSLCNEDIKAGFSPNVSDLNRLTDEHNATCPHLVKER